MKRNFFILFWYCTVFIVVNAGAEDDLNFDNLGNNLFYRPATTYEKFLPLALEGDPEVQNFLGFMFFHGEGVQQNFETAHSWFHQAADQNNLKAQRNLSVFHSGTVADVPQKYRNMEEASEWSRRAEENYQRLNDIGLIRFKSQSDQQSYEKKLLDDGKVDIGEKTYLTFCAGCHGYDGIATYPNAPSFALGERLQKENTTLMESIINGNDGEPGWGDTLEDDLLGYTLAFIRERFGNIGGDYRQQSDNDFETAGMSSTLQTGEEFFSTFCAGCHGFNGIAYYVNSPSFALGERLHKSDSELQNSITYGKGVMPNWKEKLSQDQIRSIVAFIRTLQTSFQNGIAGNLRGKPRIYFRFRPIGEDDIEWLGADPLGIPLHMQ
jgi:mono/diheme cytochrome c family protein